MKTAAHSLYIHFPYCKHRCPYCDFNVHTEKYIPQQKFIDCLIDEARNKVKESVWQNRTVSSIFMGGGTPSLFETGLIGELIRELRIIFSIKNPVEITLEANPENINRLYADGLLEAGINRLSLGVQSLQDSFLKSLGRVHSAQKAKQAFSAARQAGFNNINLDLMFALPDQDLDQLKIDLQTVTEMNPDHISCYNLTIEKGTNFYQRFVDNKLLIADDSLSAQMMELIIDTLQKNRYRHYEISNYAKSGKECQHNLGYWKMQDYLGLGPGAHSAYCTENAVIHFSNITNPEKYMQNPANCKAWEDTAEGNNFLLEKIMLALRLQDYFNIESVLDKLNFNYATLLKSKLLIFEQEGFLEYRNGKIRLSTRGLLILDSILAEIADILK